MPMTWFESVPEFLAVCAVVAVAQVVYVLFGFGSGLITVAGLALLVPDLTDVVVLVLLVNIPIELSIVLRSRRSIEWTGVLRLAVGIVLGIPVGTALLRTGRPDVLLGLLGGTLLILSPALARVDGSRPRSIPRSIEPVTGAVSGILTGLFGTGGPPLIVHFHLAGKDKARFRGNLMALFLLMAAVRLPTYVLGGLVTVPRIGAAIAVLPAVLGGAWIGHRVHAEIAEERFRSGVVVALFGIGLVLIFRAVR